MQGHHGHGIGVMEVLNGKGDRRGAVGVVDYAHLRLLRVVKVNATLVSRLPVAVVLRVVIDVEACVDRIGHIGHACRHSIHHRDGAVLGGLQQHTIVNGAGVGIVTHRCVIADPCSSTRVGRLVQALGVGDVVRSRGGVAIDVARVGCVPSGAARGVGGVHVRGIVRDSEVGTLL